MTVWVVVSTTVGTLWTNVTYIDPTITPAVWDDGTTVWDLTGNVIEALWDCAV